VCINIASKFAVVGTTEEIWLPYEERHQGMGAAI